MVVQKKIDYAELTGELDAILLQLQQEALDIDVAMRQYERGLEIVGLLEKHLKDAETTVAKLKAQAG